MTVSIRFLPVGVAMLASVAACSDSTGTGSRGPVSLSFSTVAGATASVSRASMQLVGAPDVVVITRAQFVFSKTELEREGVSCIGALESDEDSCPDLKIGPMLVDLPLDATAKGVLTVNLPAGTYSEFEAKIDAIMNDTEGTGNASATFLAANPEFRGVSIRVEGTFNGQPFVYTTAAEGDLEMDFTPSLVLDGSATNFTVHVNLSSWFRRADGTPIDPRTATAGTSVRELIDENIKRSFDVFEDDDRDGRDN